MADGLPPLNMDVNASGAAVVIVDGQEVQDVSGLLDLAPNIVEPKYARAYARLVNHLTHGYEYNVIMDPAAFETRYRAKYEAEDPDAKPRAGQIRLRNYALPNFSAIQPPAIEGSKLIFYAENAYLGVPYRVEAGTAVSTIGKPEYSLVPSTAD
ncbi:MAG: hypothetical protein AAGG09_02315 [Pseudomonadota bacterium]